MFKRSPIELLESELADHKARAEKLRQKLEKARAENDEAVSSRRLLLDNDFEGERLADADQRLSEARRTLNAFLDASDATDTKIADAKQRLDAARDKLGREKFAEQIQGMVTAATETSTKLDAALDRFCENVQGLGGDGFILHQAVENFKFQLALHVPAAIQFAQGYRQQILDGAKPLPPNVKQSLLEKGKAAA